jgi:excisionase family DNA binding protein
MAETMTHAAAARYIGCCRRTVYNLVARGLIREIPFGRFKRVKAADVRRVAEKGFRSPAK